MAFHHLTPIAKRTRQRCVRERIVMICKRSATCSAALGRPKRGRRSRQPSKNVQHLPRSSLQINHLATPQRLSRYAHHSTVTETDDAALIDAIVAHRSERAARALVDRHSPRLLAVVRRLLASDLMSAEDVLQQAWINAITALREFRREAAFSTWITRIAIRTALDHLRRRPDLRDSMSDADLAQLSAPNVDLDHRLDLDRLVTQLPSGCRGVLVLHDVEGFTHEEIAEHFGIAVGTSKAHLFRARRLLRGWLTSSAVQETLP